MRIGNDLIISGDGQKLVVGNYFKGESRPALTSKDGATLSGHIVDALTGHVHYAQATAPVAGQVIGHVLKMSGSATCIRNGVAIELHIGDAVQKGDVVQTGSDSSIGMTFVDGSAFGMTANARMVLNEMIYDPSGSSNSSLMSLVQGTITFVAGQTAKNGNMRVETPVATMGIRGTAVLVEIAADNGPTKFSVLVEPDGHTGSFNLYDKTTGQLIGTVSQAGQVTFVSSLGIGQPPTAVEQLKTLQDQAQEKAIIQQVFQLYFPNYNPDDSKPNSPKFGSNTSGNNLAEITFTTVPHGSQTALTQIELRFAYTDPLTGITTYTNRIFYNAKATFSAIPVFADQALVPTTETFKLADVVKIDDVDIGHAPFYDVGVPFVAGSAVIKSAVSTIGYLTETFLKPLLHINQTTGVVSFDREQFNFLDDGETVTFMVQVTATSGPDTGIVVIPVTITGVNDAPTIVVGAATTVTGAVTEDVAVAPSGHIAADGTITFQDVDLTDAHTASVGLTSTASTLPGFVAGTEIGHFTIDPVSESTTDTNNHGSVGWHFKLNDDDPTLQSLAKDQTITQVYTITIKDNNGVPVTETVTITIIGTNDTPVLTADVGPPHVTDEVIDTTDAAPTVVDTVSGSLTFADVDLSDTHSASASLHSGTSVVWSGGPSSGIPSATLATLGTAMTATIADSTGSGFGLLDWQFKLPDHLFDFLAHGETLTLTYDVTVTDNNGASSTQQVTVQVGANNDKPVITVAGSDFSAAVREDVDVAAGDVLKDTGLVTFTDTDLSDTHTVHVSYTGAVGGNGGTVSSALGGAGGALLTALTVPAAALGAGNHSFNWDFALDNQLVQYLAVGETITVTYAITVSDNSNGTNDTSVPQTVTVTITGTNDEPTITSSLTDASAIVPELPNLTGSAVLDAAGGTVTFGDADLTDTHQITQSATNFVWSGGGLTPTQIADLTAASARTLTPHDSTGTGNGSIDWTYKITDAALDFLAKDETLTVTYDITVADLHNGVANDTSTSQTVTITYIGANDAPTVAAVTTPTLVDTPAEDTFAPQTGTLVGTDVDSGETAGLTYDALDSVNGYVNAPITGQYGLLTVNSDGTYSYAPNAALINALQTGSYSDVFTVRTTDAHGASGTATLTVNITGANDAPVGVNDALAPVGPGWAFLEDTDTTLTTAQLLANDTDVDTSHGSLSIVGFNGTAALAGATAHGGTVTLNGGLITYHPAGDYNGPDSFIYTLSDGSMTSTATVSFNVAVVNDEPVISVDHIQLTPHGLGVTTVSGMSVSDVDDSGSSPLTVAISADHGTVAPSGGTATLGAINAALQTGLVYTPTDLSPIGHGAITVTDSHGASDTVNFVFRQSGSSPLILTENANQKDVLIGGSGMDQFVFADHSGQDTILKFTQGTDKIDFHALTGMDVSALTSLLAQADHIGSDTLLHLNGNTDTLLVKGIAALNANDFILHA